MHYFNVGVSLSVCLYFMRKIDHFHFFFTSADQYYSVIPIYFFLIDMCIYFTFSLDGVCKTE